MRLAYYAGASTAAAAACLLKAFHERPNFYSATVYLSQSNACLLILTNLLLVLACTFMYALQRLLYGPLRPIEIEQLSEKAWYAVLDTLLAMPSFREDVGGWLLAMFTLLLAGKVWGWIGEGKVDVLEQQPPANPRLFHTRLATSLITSVIFDIWMLDYCIETVLADPRPGMMVIFTFEFAILAISSTFTLSRYSLSCIQARVEKLQMKKAIDDRKSEIRAERAAARQNETAEGQPAPASPPNEEPIEVDENEVDVPGWEEKRRYLFFFEVFTDFIKLMIYIVFFTVSITFNGLPMHIMRDVYMTFASFSKRVSDYVAYRKATSDMNTRYPDATTEEIREDACIVCREAMVAWDQPDAQGEAQPVDQQPAGAPPTPARRRDEGLRAKKLPCGHILHLRCLKAWLERQQVCPTCRRPVVVPTQPGTAGQRGVAGGPNAAVPGQRGAQHPQPQLGRARFFNFGPIRIGLLRGPGDQINNFINQMQNRPAGGGQRQIQDAVAQDANQQGPNHLGLEVPYADGNTDVNTNLQRLAATTDRLRTVTSRINSQTEIQQMEQRLMQEAQDLGIEQQQLSALRSMQVEMARLRAMHSSQQQSDQPAAHSQALPTIPNPGYMPLYPGQDPSASVAVPFHGRADQQSGNGHANLPQGLTLPEGWTVMPLHRTDAGNTQQFVPQPMSQPLPHISSEASARLAQSARDYMAARAPQEELLQQQQSETNNAVGPTSESGSPLFVPSVPAANSGQQNASVTSGSLATPADVSSSQGQSDSQGPGGSQGQADSEAPADSQRLGDTKAPWTSEGWSFVDPPNGDSPNGEQAQAASLAQADYAGEATSSEDQRYTGKGKGKAAEVEDVPDAGT